MSIADVPFWVLMLMAGVVVCVFCSVVVHALLRQGEPTDNGHSTPVTPTLSPTDSDPPPFRKSPPANSIRCEYCGEYVPPDEWQDHEEVFCRTECGYCKNRYLAWDQDEHQRRDCFITCETCGEVTRYPYRPRHACRTECEVCNVSLRSDRLQVHNQRVHGDLVRCQRCGMHIRNDGIDSHNRKHHDCNCKEILPARKTTCPVCGVEVNRDRLFKHLRRVHGEDVYRRYEPIRRIWLTTWKSLLIIDGSSVMGQPPRLALLLSLVRGLTKQEQRCLVLVDELAGNRLRDHQGGAYRAILTKLFQRHSNFVALGSMERTRESILAIADWGGVPVVSNHDFTSYQDRFPWLADKSRMLSCKFNSNVIEAGPWQLENEALSIGPLQKALRRELRDLAEKHSRV